VSNQPHERRSLPTSGEVLTPDLDLAREQVDRILASNTLRGSEVLRRLFRFLADKTFCGQGDELKEYSIGLDALGKPPTYDPRQDAAVRLQASRLRQKIEEYYRAEGVNDPLVIELPRGRFNIVWRRNGTDRPATLQFAAALQGESRNLARWRGLALSLAITSAVLFCISAWLIVRLSQTPAANSPISGSTPELEALWRPFISSAHHLIIVFSDPIFVRFQREGSPDILLRQKDVTGWDEALSSPEFSAMSRTLGHSSAKPSFEYTLRGELVATFMLGQFLAPRRRDVSVIRVDQLTWQQFADNDVVFLAPRDRVAEKEGSLPVHLAFIADKSGIRNLKPLRGEPPIYNDPQAHQEGSGETFELVSLMPGPLGRTTVASFTGGGAWGVSGAIQSLTDPAFARVVVRELKGSSGRMPASYQVVIRIGYRDGTPTEASYVTHRVLTLAQSSAESRVP
jgi:hypothetical protein